MTDTNDPPASPNAHLGVLRASVLAVLGRHVSDATLDDEEPDVVFLTEKARELEELALRLAQADPNDPTAVDQLRKAAGRKKQDLRRAAADVRLGGLHHENRVDHVANKNLLAAATGGAFEPLTDDEDAWFSALEALDQMPESDSFQALEKMQPGLAALEVSVRREAPELWTSAREDSAAVVDFVVDGLRPLVGPEASSDLAVVKTRLANGICRVHLLRLVGVPLSD